MSIRRALRNSLINWPRLDGQFRRHVWSRLHFPEVEMKILNSLPPRSLDVAIDVGAALGAYSWILERKAREVYAFEPGAVHGQYLEMNATGSRTKLVRAAVGDRAGIVKMYTPGDSNEARHTATLSTKNPVSRDPGVIVREVEQVTLDGYFATRLPPVRKVDLLKVDVEGYEYGVFRGALVLLETHLPIVICEIEARHDPQWGRTFDLLRDLGYHSYVYHDGIYNKIIDKNIALFQTEDALERRLLGRAAGAEPYLNNFVFQHERSNIKFIT